MLKRLLFVALAFPLATLTAQVTLTDAYFPLAGDTLRTDVADSMFAADLDIGLPGADQAYYFGDPIIVEGRSRAVVATDSAGPFPAADVLIATDNLVSYYQSTATGFDLVGVIAEVPFLDSFVVNQAVTPARSVRRAPLSYLDEFTAETSNQVTISPDSLPAEALELLGTAVNNVDSLRITTISNRTDLVDGWGTARLGDNFYPVLREKRTENVNIRVEAKVSSLPFIDVTGTVQELAPEFAALIGEQPTVTTYFYWNAESKEPIAEITQAADGSITNAVFKRVLTATSTRGPALNRAEMKVFPNPAVDVVTFQVDRLERGTYHLAVISSLGRTVFRQEFTPFGDQTQLTLEVGNLPAGLYLCNLRNAGGRSLGTKMLRVR